MRYLSSVAVFLRRMDALCLPTAGRRHVIFHTTFAAFAEAGLNSETIEHEFGSLRRISEIHFMKPQKSDGRGSLSHK